MELSFIQEQLDTKGYCIMPNILNKDELTIKGLSKIWLESYLKKIINSYE